MAPARTSRSGKPNGRNTSPRSDELLARAVELANVGSWEIDLEKNTAIWSPQLFRMMGVRPQKQPMSPDYWVGMIHPEDRDAALNRVVTLKQDGMPVESEVRFVTRNRGVRAFRTRSVAVRNKAGKVVRIHGMTQDVTEQRQAEDKLRERTATVEHAEEVAKLGSWRYDYATNSFSLSPNMRKILGIGPDDRWTSELYWSRVSSSDRERAQAIFGLATRERKPFEFEVQFAPMNGGLAYLHTRGITFCDEAGNLTYRVGVVQDVTDRHKAERQFRQREQLLAHAERIANLGSYEYDFKTNKATLSPNLCEIYGFVPEEESYREEYWERVHPDDRGWARKLLEDAVEGKKSVEFVVRFLHHERGLRYLRSSGVPVLNEAGEQVRRVGVVQDITEQYELEKKRREREALLAHAEQLANLGSYRYDHGKKRVIPSENLSRIYGFAPGDEWSRADYWERVHPEDREWTNKIVSDSIESKQTFDYVSRFVHPERGVRYLHTRGVPILNEPSDEFRRVGVVQDITEQYEAQQRTREHEALLTNAEQVRNFGFWMYELATKTMSMSPQMREMYGLAEGEEWTSEGCWQRVHADDQPRIRAIMGRAAEDEKPFEFVMRFTPLGKSQRFFFVRGAPVTDAGGKVVRRAGVVQDITEHYEVEQKMREREALMAHAEEIANLGSWQYEFATGKLTLSPQLRKIYGLGPNDEWTNDFYWSRVHPTDRERVGEIVERATREKAPFECVARFVSIDGTVRHMRLRAVPVLDAAGNLIRRVGIAQDVTRWHDAERKMQEREDLLGQAEEVAKLGSWQYDFASDRFTLSPHLRKILGLDADEIWNGKAYWDRVHEEDRERAREVVRQATRERRPFDFVIRFVIPASGVRYIQVRGAALLDETGWVVRRVGVAQDITEHVRNEEELRRLSHQLIRTRDEERRQIARELHETAGQSLAAMKMTLGRLRDGMEESNEAGHSLLRSAVELAEAAIREVRTVSYLMHPPMLDEAGLGPALRWYARGFAERSGIRVEAQIPEHLPRQTREVETTIFRIVQEALTNVHRYSHSATAQVRVWCRDGAIHAEVRDQGRGFAPGGRFLGEATALEVGIAGMRERVAQLRGVFELESAEGEGTSVRVSLPTKAGDSGARASAEAERRARERRKEAN